MHIAWLGLLVVVVCVLSVAPHSTPADVLDESWINFSDAQLHSRLEQTFTAPEALDAALAILRSLLDNPNVEGETLLVQGSHLSSYFTLSKVCDVIGLHHMAERLRQRAQQKRSQHPLHGNAKPGKAGKTWRPPHTYYDATDLWPDWDFDAARAALAVDVHNVQPVTNGWEQTMWGPFVKGIEPRTVPGLKTIQDAHDTTRKQRALLYLFGKLIQRACWRSPTRTAEMLESTETQKRTLAIRLLEWVAIGSADRNALEADTTDVQRDALWILGEHSLWGTHGASPNISRAIHSFERLAASGNATAHARLGFLYSSPLMGRVYNTSTHLDRALLHYTIAAKQGERHAELALAHRYRFGHGVKKDCAKALYHYESQASKSYSMSTAVLGGRVPSYSKWSIHILDGIVRRTQKVPKMLYHTLNIRDTGTMIFASSSDPDMPSAALKALEKYPSLLQREHTRRHLLNLVNAGQVHDARLLYILSRALYHGSFFGPSETIGEFPRDWIKSAQLAEQVAQLMWPKTGSKRKELSPDDRKLAMKAAEQLGMQYLLGEGVAQNVDIAYQWFMRAKEVDKGLPRHLVGSDFSFRASLGLGLIALHGVSGNAQNTELALEHFNAHKLWKEGQKKKSPFLDFELAKLDLQKGDMDSAREQLIQPLDSINLFGSWTYLYPRVENPYVHGAVRLDSFLKEKGNTCEDVVEKFKEAAERGDWADPIYHRGSAAYSRNDIPSALLSFAIAADAGVWEGQVNSAYLLEASTYFISPRQERSTSNAQLFG